MVSSFKQLNVLSECKAVGLSPWQCPPFLFILMGFINVVSIVITYQIATRAIDETEYVVLAVFVVSTLVFVVGSAVVLGFDKVVEANQMKSEFIGIISHQLRSPLAIFKWTLNALGENLQKQHVDSETSNAIFALNDTNERMIHLVNMLLEVNRIESNRFTFQKKLLSVDALTKKNISQQKNYADSLGITLQFDSDYSDELNADEDKLQMVIQNLIDNAVRYAKKNTTIYISIQKKAKEILWKITNTGIGIPLTEQKNIFSKFFRGKGASIYQAEGNGIGLYIAKKIIEQHGGTIGFSSEENRDTSFWFTIPITNHSS